MGAACSDAAASAENGSTEKPSNVANGGGSSQAPSTNTSIRNGSKSPGAQNASLRKTGVSGALALSSLGKSFKLRRTSSYDTNDPHVLQEKEKWQHKVETKMKKSAETLTKSKDWERLFDEMTKELGKAELTVQEMSGLFNKMGIRINNVMLQLLFNLMDTNSNGLVERGEFVTATFFLTQRNKAQDTFDLAFRLFDSNLSGSISKDEFAEMAVSLMVRTSFLLAVPALRKAFRAHLEAERCTESLDFIEAVERAREEADPALAAARAAMNNSSRRGGKATRSSMASMQGDEDGDVGGGAADDGAGDAATALNTSKPLDILTSTAKTILDEYVLESGASQVNLSAKNRTAVQKAVAKAVEDNAERVSSESIDRAVAEILNLLETDSMPRFQTKLRKDPRFLADQIWKEEKLSGQAMNRSQFRRWAKRNPGVFSFLDEFNRVLRRAEYKQRIAAAVRIQRAFRLFKAKAASKSSRKTTHAGSFASTTSPGGAAITVSLDA